MQPYILYDLEVSVMGEPETFACSHRAGYAFSVLGENLTFIQSEQFSLYAMAALLPLLPAMQRPTHANDWLDKVTFVRCPVASCGAQFKIERVGRATFQKPNN